MIATTVVGVVLNVVLGVMIVGGAIGAVIGHCSAPAPPPPRPVSHHRERHLWIVDHREGWPQ